MNVLKIHSYELPPLGDLFVENGNSSSLKVENVIASIDGDDMLRVHICTRGGSDKSRYINGYQGSLVVNPFTCFYLIYKGWCEIHPLPVTELKGYNVIDVYHPEPNRLYLVGRRTCI